MMNGIWGGMILVGVVYGIMTGHVGEITNAAIDSSKEAVTLCITMLGVMAMWNGLMEVAGQSGLIQGLTQKMSGVITYLFPGIPRNHKAREYMATNFIANILGLGWAATPAGLKAMEELKMLKDQIDSVDKDYHIQADVHKNQRQCGKQNVASDEMCTFLILNISSLQLIPINIIAYRSQYGSVNPAAVVMPGILATLCSTLTAVIFCKIRMFYLLKNT